MHLFHEELKTTKASHKKIKLRLRALRKFILWHYILLGLSGVQAALTLFVVVNYPGPYKDVMFAALSASLALSCYLLYSGLSK